MFTAAQKIGMHVFEQQTFFYRQIIKDDL